MEKQPTKKLRAKRKILTEEERVIKSLLADGAEEILRSEWNKEPYKTLLKNVKRKGKFICD